MRVRATSTTLRAASVTTSRNEKLGILASADQDLLKKIFWYTYNPFLQYRITLSEDKIAPSDNRIPEVAGDEIRTAQWTKFFALLEAYAIGGVEKEDMIDFLSFQTVDDALWMTRVVNRDLKAGMAGSTAELIFGKYIPSFEVQLAEPFDKVKSYPKRAYVEPKYDGLRGIAIKRTGTPWQFVSRAGKPFWNTEFVATDLDALGLDNCVLDGEFFGENWNETQSVLKTQMPIGTNGKYAEMKSKLKFYIFDAIPMMDWERGKCDWTQEERVLVLDKLFSGKVFRNIAQPPRFDVASPEEALAYAKIWLEQGLEGGILKDKDGKYTWKRSTAWIKLKFVKEADLKITGVRMGEGRLTGYVGAVEGVDADGNKYAVGTGFSDKDRDELTKLHKADKLVGMIIECRPQDVGKGWKGSGRIAVFHRLREDKK